MRTNPDLDPDDEEPNLVWDIGISLLILLIAVGAIWWFLGVLAE